MQRALSEDDYCQQKLDLLARFDLTVPVVNNLRVGQAVSDAIDRRHQPLLPDYVWGDGKPAGVRQRAAEEMVATVRAAQKLGAAVVTGFTGSPLWSFVAGYPPLTPALLEAGLADFVRQWTPILDVCQECGLKFACAVHPGQMAFDLTSAEQVLEALGGREEFGFALAPGQLLWQGVDPVEFVRRFPERIFHVHVADVALALNGRVGLLNGYALPGEARRGWDYRSAGHGGVDWEALVRVLNEVGYEGPLGVDWTDPGMERAFGAEDACRFVKRLDFERGPRRVW